MKRFHILCVLAAASLLISCKKDPDKNTLSVDPTSISMVANDTQTKTATISTDALGWNATTSVEWLTVEKQGYTLLITAAHNSSTSKRSATVTVTAGTAPTVTVTVTQEGINTLLTHRTTLTFPANQSVTKTIEVNTDVTEWEASTSASWLVMEKQVKTLQITSLENTGTDERTASVTFSAGSAPAVTVTVYQAGINTLSAHPDAVSFVANETSTRTITVSSNVTTWEATTSATWFSLEKNEDLLRITPSVHTEIYGRTSTITLSDGFAPPFTVTVTQDGANTLSVNTHTFSFESDNFASQTAEVATDASWWQATTTATWLNLDKEDNMLIFTPETNITSIHRTATVFVTAGTAPPVAISITQKEGEALYDIQMVFLQGGAFTMGSPSSEPGRSANETQHRVTLSDFYISEHAITNEQFCLFLNASGISQEGDGSVLNYGDQHLVYTHGWGVRYEDGHWLPQSGKENYPVINVTWFGAKAFCDWAGGQLPTEAQWEYACRAGTDTPFNTGDNLTTAQANYNGNHPYNGNATGVFVEEPKPTGSYAPNDWGLYDMHGNVWEWCHDIYGEYSANAVTNPQGPSSGSIRVLRGGSWRDYALYCRSAYRNNLSSGNYGITIGFRMAINDPVLVE